ncbi:hypothetical protein BRADI_1g34166v3 [Brachypodium distachyon]|uniref:Uncharacterized protein n=1 Tax=Brachypodium distachyon TaxID=15368 RepID=A0A0Q3RXE4_BRADI|nr:hypothetical protein BRADI_1g34166v3 [Brachypodium distachyon]
MAITTDIADPQVKEDIMSLVHDGIADPQVEEDLTALQSSVRKGLQALTAFPTIAQLDWVDSIEGYAVKLAAQRAEDAGDLSHGAHVFAWRLSGGAADDLFGAMPSEEDAVLVAELRRQAAWCEAPRAQTGALAADARRLREKHLRAASGISMENKDGGEASARRRGSSWSTWRGRWTAEGCPTPTGRGPTRWTRRRGPGWASARGSWRCSGRGCPRGSGGTRWRITGPGMRPSRRRWAGARRRWRRCARIRRSSWRGCWGRACVGCGGL